MNSSRPYIIRAIYEWIVDNDLTPYILVDTSSESVIVPEDSVENGRIILNLSPMATRDLHIGNDGVVFNARFGGCPMDVFVPTGYVLAIYAQENGQGMVFGEAGEDLEAVRPNDDLPPPPPSSPSTPPKGRPSLKVVK